MAGRNTLCLKLFNMNLVMFDWLIAEVKKEKIRLPDGQFASKVLGDLFFAANVRGWVDLFDKSQHELERIMMADRLLTFRLEEKIKSLKY